MDNDVWNERRLGLEAVFFNAREQELIAAQHATSDRDVLRAELTKATGIVSESILDSMHASGLTPATAAALALVPLVLVAWADGEISPQERDTILRTAAAEGIKDRSPAYSVLARWLSERPEARLFDTWEAYVETLAYAMDDAAFRKLGTEVLDRAHKIAESAGGLLNKVFKVSEAERAVLRRISESFEL